MAGLLGWLLSTFWSREYVLRRSKYNVPLPEQCHVTLDEETIAGRPVFVVGDVHGCCEELCQLLQLAENRRKNPFIMFVGDMVNKGPQNVDVLRLVKEMSRHGQAACVRGNHEESVLRELWRVRMSPETYCLAHRHQWLRELTEDDFDFLQELPYTLSLPSEGALVVHAGLVPGLPLEVQSLENLTHMRSIVQGREDICTWGDLLGTNRIDDGEPWASLWKGPEHVYFGHDAQRGLQRWPFATGLDTGCLYGRQLTGVFIGNDMEFLSVQAKQTF